MTSLSGGCQCGAVRFRVERSAVNGSSICHCRMCQKAVGGFYASYANCEPGGVVWTRGQRATFQSSNLVRRGFCAACGTPLTYEPAADEASETIGAFGGLSIAVGAFDDPAALPPTIQYGTEGKLPYTDGLHDLPSRTTESTETDAAWLADVVSFQHPDHDTTDWAGGKGK